jgi:hypothetical protein
MSAVTSHDPRAQLVRDKYFSLRPKPLERWLWAQGIPAAAERVFWLHWQEGLQRGDWCSEVPLKRVARECCVDPSTVTRAYQVLIRLGCLRRSDPGRDPANPFNQATAVTEVRVPRELLVELDRHPNRRSRSVPEATEPSAPLSADPIVAQDPTPDTPADPFAGLGARERLRALNALTARMSAGEESRYKEALRLHRTHLEFDGESHLSAAEQGRVLQFLGCIAAQPSAAARPVSPVPATVPKPASRKLSTFELARLKRELQSVRGCEHTPELMRQVVWSIEEGSLHRFAPLHALHIALKKIREGAWTRPNRMPPNWMRALSAAPETCRRA